MGSYIAAAALAVGSASAYALYKGVQTCAASVCRKPQDIESKNLSEFNNALTRLGQALLKEYPKFLEPVESLTIQRYEQIIDFLEHEDLPRPKEEMEAFRSTWKAYREHLDTFVDQEYSGQTTFEKAQEAQKEAQSHSEKNEQLNGRVAYFEHRLMQERLALGDTTEEGAYAHLLKIGEELALARKHYTRISHPKVKEKIFAHQEAVTTHRKFVQKWQSAAQQPIGNLCSTVEKNLKTGTDPFVWQGRAKALQIPQNLFKTRVQTLIDNIATLKRRIVAIDPALIGESRWGTSSWKIGRLYNWLANFFSCLITWSSSTLVSDYRTLLKAQETLKAPPKPLPVPEVAIPIGTPQLDKPANLPPTPKEVLIEFLQTIPRFRKGMEAFIQQTLPIPDDATVKREGNILTITLPSGSTAPRSSIDAETSLTQEEFRILNRNKDQENLRHLAGKKLPKEQQPPANPKIKDLKYFRSLGPGVTKGLISGAQLTAGTTIRIKIKENTLEFLEGGPKIEGSSSVTITALELRDTDDALAKQEQGIIRVHSKSGWMPLPSDDYFVSDLGRLLPKMQSR